MQLYVIISLVLFNVITYASASIFRTTHNQIKQHNNIDSETLSDPEIYTLLQKTKRQHHLGCNTASITNECFGWTLLLATFFIFFSFINMSFYMYNDIVDGSPPSEILIDVLFLAYSVIQLSLICILGDYLRYQVTYNLPRVYQLQNCVASYYSG